MNQQLTGPSGGAGEVHTENTINIHTFTANETVTWSLSGG